MLVSWSRVGRRDESDLLRESVKRLGIVEHDGAVRSPLPHERKNPQHAKRESVPRPAERRVLHQNPPPGPILALSPEVNECAEVSSAVPSDFHKLQSETSARKCVLKPAAVIVERVSRFVPLTQ